MNLVTYVKRNTATFNEAPFNDVDALVLSWLSYFTFPDYLKSEKSVKIKDFKTLPLLPDKQAYEKTFNPKTSKRLFNLLMQSRRFSDIQLYDFHEDLDESIEKQFAALSIKISNDLLCVAFRGTDFSFAGLKEDLNLAYDYPVPSQSSALDYLTAAINKAPLSKVVVAGHSKGGNLAVYAATELDEFLQPALFKVYNFDGPGFIKDVYEEAGYKRVRDKILKIIPDSSFIGMILETKENFQIVKSRTVSFFQHNPFSWIIKNDDFAFFDKRSKSSIKLERALNEWIRGLSVEERKRFVGIIYGSGLNELQIRDFVSFFKTLHVQIPALTKSYKNLSSDDKTFFKEKLKVLLTTYKNTKIKR